jgi:hypothetical protein
MASPSPRRSPSAGIDRAGVQRHGVLVGYRDRQPHAGQALVAGTSATQISKIHSARYLVTSGTPLSIDLTSGTSIRRRRVAQLRLRQPHPHQQ